MLSSRKSHIETEEMLRRLERLGISRNDAETLRRISMTLHHWHEMECGTDNGCIERDETTNKPCTGLTATACVVRLSQTVKPAR